MSNFDPNQSPTDPQPQPQPQPQSQYSPPPQTQPAQGYSPPPQTVYQQPAPKKSNRNIFLIIGGVLLLLVCGCIGSVLAFGGAIFGGVMAATQPMTDAGDRFMTALRDGNYDSAYNMCTPSLQSEFGDVATFESRVQNSRPTTWTFNSRNISNDQGQLDGSATLANGSEADLRLVLRNVSNSWKIEGVQIEPK